MKDIWVDSLTRIFFLFLKNLEQIVNIKDSKVVIFYHMHNRWVFVK